MIDLKPFKHGQEGTHAICNKHMAELGWKGGCCECTGKTDCGDEPVATNRLTLRDEWREKSYDIGFSGDYGHCGCVLKIDEIADFFISRFQAQLEILAGSVEGLKSTKIDWPDTTDAEKNVLLAIYDGKNLGLGSAASLIRTFSQELK